MRSINTTYAFPLSSVKPLESLQNYRNYCLSETRKTLESGKRVRREQCPSCGEALRSLGAVNGLGYARCSGCASFLLEECSDGAAWTELLKRVSEYRRSPGAFHSSMMASRNESVYLPKLEWIEHTLRLQGLSRPRILEIASLPSPFTPLLTASGAFREVVSLPESAPVAPEQGAADAAVMLECLDRAADAPALLKSVAAGLRPGGLVFVTALVSSGFDISVLGLNNLYIYPPDRTHCFSLGGMVNLLKNAGFKPVEVSTPGVLDVQILAAHAAHDSSLPLSAFERQILSSDEERKEAFQTFLQENLMSSFARIVARLS